MTVVMPIQTVYPVGRSDAPTQNLGDLPRLLTALLRSDSAVPDERTANRLYYVHQGIRGGLFFGYAMMTILLFMAILWGDLGGGGAILTLEALSMFGTAVVMGHLPRSTSLPLACLRRRCMSFMLGAGLVFGCLAIIPGMIAALSIF